MWLVGTLRAPQPCRWLRDDIKKMLVMATVLVSAAALFAGEYKQHTELEMSIQGDWLAAELFYAQPSKELNQAIKSVSFRTNNIVVWVEITNNVFSLTSLRDGKVKDAKIGRYGIYSFATDKTPRPRLTVSPTNYPNAELSSHILLSLSELELDFDARFPQSLGKLLKAVGPDGKRLLFMRKDSEFNSQPTSAGDVLEAAPEK